MKERTAVKPVRIQLSRRKGKEHKITKDARRVLRDLFIKRLGADGRVA